MATVTDFINTFCKTTGMDKDTLRASANRDTANKVRTELNKMNGLSAEEYNEQLKVLLEDVKMYSATGNTKVRYKYTSTNPIAVMDDEDVETDETVTETATPKKNNPLDYVVRVYVGDSNHSEKGIRDHGTNFKKFLGSSYAASILKELGYKVAKTTIQSGRKYKRMFDVFEVVWTKG